MTNNEKFNALLNSCAHHRQIYNVLLASVDVDFARRSVCDTNRGTICRQAINVPTLLWELGVPHQLEVDTTLRI